MADQRELTRREARRRRAAARLAKFERSKLVCQRVDDAMRRARQILSDRDFVRTMQEHSHSSLPRCLLTPSTLPNDHELTQAEMDKTTLEFVVAWSFFYPTFNNPAIASYLEKVAPRFTLDMKDAFIALVVEGPFPHVLSGHRGRRHPVPYHAPSDEPQKNAKFK